MVSDEVSATIMGMGEAWWWTISQLPLRRMKRFVAAACTESKLVSSKTVMFSRQVTQAKSPSVWTKTEEGDMRIRCSSSNILDQLSRTRRHPEIISHPG